MVGIQVSEDMKDYPLNPTRSKNLSSDDLSVEKMLTSIEKVTASSSMRRFSRSELQKTLTRYRLMVFIQSLNEVPADIDLKKNYFIEYSLFDQKIKYKLDVANIQRRGKQNYLPINKVKIFYFFSPNQRTLTDFLYEEKVRFFFRFFQEILPSF